MFFNPEFVEKSAITEDCFDSAIKSLSDVEVDPVVKEAIATPIDDGIGFRYTRFTHSAKSDRTAAAFVNEDGGIWQLKVFGESAEGRTGRYLAPKGIGNKPYFPPVPYRLVLAIALEYGLKPPAPDESFWLWVLKNPIIPIAITEGGKKSLSLLSRGIVAIALYGCDCGTIHKDANGREIPLQLLPELVPYARDREIIIAFDRDTNPKAKTSVARGTYRIGVAIAKAGGIARVATWDSSLGKGIDDVAYLQGTEKQVEIIASAALFEDWRIKSQTDLSTRINLRLSERFLTLDSLAIPEDSQLIGLKSPKGTGKTEVIGAISEKAIYRGVPVLAIGHRIKLLVEMSDRLGIAYRTDRDATKSLLGYALCVDSLHPKANPPFNPNGWDGAIVIIDEAEQVVWHLLNSPTCAVQRAAILETLRDLLRNALSTGGKILLSDADLSLLSIEFFEGLIDSPVPTWIVENTWKRPTDRPLFVYDSKPKLLSALLGAIERGEKTFIATGSQKFASKYGTQNLETLIKTQFPDLAILRIDRESVSDPTHPAYKATDNLTELLSRYDAVICSPTLETGVSITGNHFDSVWCFATGSQTVEGVCQSIERVRSDVPRHLFAEKRHNNTIGNGADNPYALLRGEKRKSDFTFQQIAGLDSIARLDGERGEITLSWGKYAAIHNARAYRYDRAIVSKLLEEGYKRESPTDGGDYAPEEIIQTIADLTRKENLETDRAAVVAADNPTDDEFDRLNEKESRTEKERHTLRKGKLCRRYLTTDITETIVKRDNEEGWFYELIAHYYLTTGREFLMARDSERIRALGETGKVFPPDVNRTALVPKIRCLEFLNIARLLDPSASHDAASLADWFAGILPFRADIKLLLGFRIDPDKDTPIGAAQRVLAVLGLKLVCTGRLGARGERRRIYQLLSPDLDGRNAIFERWYERDIKSASTPSIDNAITGDGENCLASA